MQLYINKHIVLSLLLALATYTFTNAQTHSGFMGKHFILHYDYTTSPSFTNPTKESTSEDYFDSRPSLKGFNHLHNIDAEWMINKGYSTGILFHIMNSYSAVNKSYSYYENETVSIYSEESSYTETEAYNEKFITSIKAYSIGLTGTIFLKNINPIGGYLKFEIFRTNYKVAIDEDHRFSNENTEPFVDDNYHTYGVTMQLGKQKIFFDRVSVRYGIQVGHVFKSIGFLDYTKADLIYYTSNQRLRALYDFNINLGVGYLIF